MSAYGDRACHPPSRDPSMAITAENSNMRPIEGPLLFGMPWMQTICVRHFGRDHSNIRIKKWGEGHGEVQAY